MSRYSYSVEKLILESKKPSLGILLEKEDDDKKDNDSGFDIFDKEDSEEEASNSGEDKSSPGQGAPDDEEENEELPQENLSADNSQETGPGEAEIEAKLDSLIKKLDKSNDQQDEISDTVSDIINKIYNYKRRLRDSLGGLVTNVVGNNVLEVSYIKKGISDFIFLNEEIDNVEDEAIKLSKQKKIDLEDVENLEDLMSKSGDNLENPREIAKIFIGQINKFSHEDVALYTLKQALKFFQEFSDPDISHKFDNLVELFNNLAGLNIEINYVPISGKKSKYISLRKNQTLPDLKDIANVCFNYYNRFDKKDIALYYLDLAEDYFEDYISENKKELFEQFLDIYNDYLQRAGIDLQSDRANNTSFKIAAGAKASAGG